MRFYSLLLLTPLIVSCKHTTPTVTYCHEGDEPVFHGHRMIQTIRPDKSIESNDAGESAVHSLPNHTSNFEETRQSKQASLSVGAKIWLTFTNISAQSLDVEVCKITGLEAPKESNDGFCSRANSSKTIPTSVSVEGGAYAHSSLKAGEVWSIELPQPFSCQLPLQATLAYTKAKPSNNTEPEKERVVKTCIIPFSGIPKALPITLLEDCKSK